MGAAIGTVDKIYPPRTRFALAGLTWGNGGGQRQGQGDLRQSGCPACLQWTGMSISKGAAHRPGADHAARAGGGQSLSYLSASCRERLQEIRSVARNSGILSHRVIQLSENKFAVFPWVGTRQLYTLHFLLLQHGLKKPPALAHLRVSGDYGALWFSHAREYIEAVIDEILASQPTCFPCRCRTRYRSSTSTTSLSPGAAEKEVHSGFPGFRRSAGGMAVPR